MVNYPVGDMTRKRNSFWGGKLIKRQLLGMYILMLSNNWKNSRKMSINYDSFIKQISISFIGYLVRILNFLQNSNYTVSMKKTQKGSTKNLSHRYLIKQKTKQLFYYPTAKPKPNSTIIIGLKAVDLNNNQSKKLKTVSNDDHETSICLDDGSSKNCSSDKAKHSKDSKSIIKSQRDVKQKYKRSFRSKLMSYKSVETIPRVKNMNIKDQLSRIEPSKQSINKKQTKSMQNLQNQNVQVIKKEEQRNKTEIKSESTVKQSNLNIKTRLQKQSVSKMRPKVVDPFQKRTKLQEQFENESIINRIQNASMISTQNQEQFRQLLNKIL